MIFGPPQGGPRAVGFAGVVARAGWVGRPGAALRCFSIITSIEDDMSKTTGHPAYLCTACMRTITSLVHPPGQAPSSVPCSCGATADYAGITKDLPTGSKIAKYARQQAEVLDEGGHPVGVAADAEPTGRDQVNREQLQQMWDASGLPGQWKFMRFTGYSDFRIELYSEYHNGTTHYDEFFVGIDDDELSLRLVDPESAGEVMIHGRYGAGSLACWTFSIGMTDEGAPVPAWESYNFVAHDYSMGIAVLVPATVELRLPDGFNPA